MPKPDPNEIINPKRRMDRLEKDAGISDQPEAPAPAASKAPMSQADFSGYRSGTRAARPSEADLEKAIAAKKRK